MIIEESQDVDHSEIIEKVMGEEPKIASALKNFCSMKLADGDQDQAARTMKMARALSLAINAHILPQPPQWGLLHPQGENQTAIDRLSQIAVYKVLFKMRQMLSSRENAKATQLFGRTLLEFVLSDVRASVESSVPDGEREQLSSFLDAFQLELEKVDSLVWCRDFNAEIEKRHAQRREEAKQRANKEEEQQVQYMRDQIGALVRDARNDGYEGNTSGAGLE
ncbi:hypothetical protein CYMTET_34595 [Cymbomonas tetramitiformis]|uniref:PCAF N-terminal domain-containing protein n=1 Tax=Cymbomonas tetramitiformis TaxID=36881 RepID=A0AAE0KPT5_9CHLO|nr:hypothetical protein CYMTET_34595 [Cymbomonas tetramitiformis]